MLSTFFKQYNTFINHIKHDPKSVIQYNHILFDTKVAELIENNDVDVGKYNSLKYIAQLEKQDFKPLHKHDAYVYHVVQKMAQLTKNGIWINATHTKRYLPYIIDESLSYNACKKYWRSQARDICKKKAPMPYDVAFADESGLEKEHLQDERLRVADKWYFIKKHFYSKHPLPDKPTYDKLIDQYHVQKEISQYTKQVYATKDKMFNHRANVNKDLN